MKRLMLILLTSIMGLAFVDAQNALPFYFKWKQIVCEMVPKGTKTKGRSAVNVPVLLQSEKYILVQSEYADYANVCITITNQEGETVKVDAISVTAGGENLYYIGDLESGTYEVSLFFDDFVLIGAVEL